jgi:hypothetical protein
MISSVAHSIQDGCHLGFGFRQLEDKRLGQLIQFLWLIGVD